MGKVYFVGAGSGDPELLTIKGKRIIETADVIFYDRLVHPSLLYLAKKTARFVYSGKFPKKHILQQKEINQLLIDEGKKEQIVVRLKGGDPGIFGRVGEEIETLKKERIFYEVVPGITAASAASSYSGVPLTHRDYSSKVTLATAHRQAGETLDFNGLTENGTICLYMGVEQAGTIQQKLIEQGVSIHLPVAIVEWGSVGRQRTLTTDVENMIEQVQQYQIKNPALIILGEVVTCRQGNDWFEELSLFGHKILLIDSEEITFETITSYTQKGADVYAVQVGEQRDKRFDLVHQHYLAEHTFDETIYLSEKLANDHKKMWSEMKQKLVLCSTDRY
ncbi:uroporphyrinogen-III C-methyltransferase [Enterococcus sp. LJL99]